MEILLVQLYSEESMVLVLVLLLNIPNVLLHDTAFAKMVGFSLEAAEILKRDHDIDCEVINLRSIRPLDRECIIKSVKKTNRIVNVEEGWP
jgi:deoxyxylulose-5-phosphate synthase